MFKREGLLVFFNPVLLLSNFTYRVHFFGKNTNPDSESKRGFFVSLVKSKKDYESKESACDEVSMD